MIRTLRAVRPRVVVTNTSAPVAGPLAAWLSRRRHIWYIRELIESPGWFAAYVRVVAALPAGVVITNSQAVAHWVGSVHRREVVALHNAVPPSSGHEPLGAVPTAVFVGRMNDWKGWEVFADAAALVRTSVPSAKFLLAGDTVRGSGITDKTVRTKLATLDPDATWLRWVGEVDDARSVMKEGWVVVVPSQKPEPFGNVAIEGMAEGRAVIGTRMGGLTEIISEGVNGLLIAAGSTDALAEAITALLSDRELAERMGNAARDRYQEAFTPDAHASAWLMHLSDEIGKASPESASLRAKISGTATRRRVLRARARMLAVQRPGRIARPLHRASLGMFSQEDRRRFAAIEAWRAELEGRTDVLRHTSYRLRPDGTVRDGVATVGETCRRASAPALWGQVLSSLVRELRPDTILEMGTCFGISTSYLASGCPDARVLTLEGEPAYVDIARDGFERLGVKADIILGRFETTLATALSELGSVDFAFVDGHHEEEATVAYWERLLPSLAPGAIAVFDDISWSPGMARAWRRIAGHRHVAHAVDLHKLGIVLATP